MLRGFPDIPSSLVPDSEGLRHISLKKETHFLKRPHPNGIVHPVQKHCKTVCAAEPDIMVRLDGMHFRSNAGFWTSATERLLPSDLRDRHPMRALQRFLPAYQYLRT